MAREKIDSRCRKTENTIKMTLLDLLKTKTLADISITELAKAADINRKTFYNHYTDINQLYSELEDETIERIFSLIPDIHFPIDNASCSLLFEKIAHELKNNLKLYTLFFNSLENNQLEKKMMKRLNQYIKKELSQVNVSNMNYFMYFSNFMAAGVASCVQEWFQQPDIVSLDELFVYIKRIFLNIDIKLLTSYEEAK